MKILICREQTDNNRELSLTAMRVEPIIIMVIN